MMWGVDFYAGEGLCNIYAFRAAGCEFILHQAYNAQWKWKADNLLPYHHMQAERAGVKFSAYGVFLEGYHGVQLARDLLSALPGKMDFRLAVDFETRITNWQKAEENMSLMLHELQSATGLAPYLYVNLNYARMISRYWGKWIAAFPLWLAYPGKVMPKCPAPWNDISIWQADWKLRLPGCVAELDKDYLIAPEL